MSLNIRLKHSSTKDKKPLVADLKRGELALNINNASPAGYALDDANVVQQMFGKATETQEGQAEIATQAEVTTGTDDSKIVTPLKLATAVPAATEALAGKAELATQAEVNAGTDDKRIVTPLKLATAVPAATETKAGKVELATAAETTTGTDSTRAVHPAGLKVELDKKVDLAGDTMTGNLTVPSLNGGPLAGFRNVIINGNLAINQRGVDIASVATGAYGQDRWKKTVGGMTQIIEAGSFEPSATYTLSGTGVTTQQLTAPAGGNWTLPDIPVTARKIQLEPGTVATPFEHRPIGTELALCQRYHEQWAGTHIGSGYVALNGSNPGGNNGAFAQVFFKVTKRTTPNVAGVVYFGTTPSATANAQSIGFAWSADNISEITRLAAWTASAEL